MIIFIILFFSYGLISSIAIPYYLRPILEENIERSLGRKVEVESIFINPYSLSLTLENIKIWEKPLLPLRDAKNQPIFFFSKRLFLNFSFLSLLQKAFVLEKVEIESPELFISYLSKGIYNFSDLIDHWLSPSNTQPIRFSLNNLTISKGHVQIDHQVLDRKEDVKDIQLKLPFFSNLSQDIATKVTPDFSATLGDTNFQIKGNTTPFLDESKSEFLLKVTNFSFVPYLEYLPKPLPFKITSGKLSTDLSFEFFQEKEKPLKVTAKGAASLDNFEVKDFKSRPLFSFSTFFAKLDETDFLSIFAFSDLYLKKPEVYARLTQKGDMPWLSFWGCRRLGLNFRPFSEGF